ncbi:MAG: MopE-related protein, partial [Myxococcota bacterium]
MSRPSPLLALFGPLSVLSLAACIVDPIDATVLETGCDTTAVPTGASGSTGVWAGDSGLPDTAARTPVLLPGDADGDGTPTADDCDDADPDAYPGAPETDDLQDDDCDGWVDEDFVAPGDVVVTEINRQSWVGTTATVANAAWVEVRNTSDRTVDLANWVLARGASAPFNQVTLDPAEAPVLLPGAYAVFCDTDDYEGSATAAWPLTCDYVWGDEAQPASYVGTYHDNTFLIRRDNEAISLYIGGGRTSGTLVDTVRWTTSTAGWPTVGRTSMSLDPAYQDADANDDQAVWCATTENASGGVTADNAWRWYDVSASTRDEFGTPGADNFDCPVDPDRDGDGYTGADDCDDADAAVNPGAVETCDGVDQDCDGLVDDGTVGAEWYPDSDGDGFGHVSGSITACAQPSAAYVADATDCDDTSADASPAGIEACDGLDNDCDGGVDEEVAGDNVYFADVDGDGYGDTEVTTTACTVPAGYADNDSDCDDADAAVSPDGAEGDNLADDDCDGWVDEDFIAAGDVVFTEVNRQSWVGAGRVVSDASWVEVRNVSARSVDLSNWVFSRGHSAPYNQVTLDPAEAPLLAPGDHAVLCDSATYEASAGVAYALDCDYVWSDPAASATYVGTYKDNTLVLRRDSDTVGLYVGGGRTSGTRIDAVTWSYDASGGYWPRDARFSMSLDPSYQDEVSNDARSAWCSTASSATGAVANNTAWRWYDTASTANDEHGTPGAANYDCLTDGDVDGDGALASVDCDDADATVFPGAVEACDGVDQDCDGSVDEDAAGTAAWYTDADADGYGDDATSVLACDAPVGSVAVGGDCDDASAAVNPAATETCDGVDQDCDGTADDGAPGSTTYYADTDADGYGDAASTVAACGAPAGYVADATDCDDTSATTNPAAAEVCGDGVDNDCDPDPTGCERTGSETVKAEYGFRAYGTAANYAVGHAIANGGDFDGDGFDDVIVGQAYHDEGAAADAGRTLLWYGPVDETDGLETADLGIAGGAANDQHGWQARFAGDVDGDGRDDLLSAAWRAETNDRGRAYLFLGGTSPTSVSDAFASFAPADANNYAGQAIDGGDIDGDGRADVLVSAYGRTSSAGAVAVWNATAIGGGAESLTSDMSLLVTSATAGENFGYAAEIVPDLDGEGLEDLVLGAPAAASTTTAGKAYVFYGVDTLTGTVSASTADAVLSGTASGDRFGLAVAGLGDTDGDGTNDFAVSADKEDSAGADAGAVYLFTTAPTGAATGASRASSVLTGGAASDFFGRSLAGVGDVNGEGTADVFVGATGYDESALS